MSHKHEWVEAVASGLVCNGAGCPATVSIADLVKMVNACDELTAEDAQTAIDVVLRHVYDLKLGMSALERKHHDDSEMHLRLEMAVNHCLELVAKLRGYADKLEEPDEP